VRIDPLHLVIFFASLSLKVVHIAKRTGFIFQVELYAYATADGKNAMLKRLFLCSVLVCREKDRAQSVPEGNSIARRAMTVAATAQLY